MSANGRIVIPAAIREALELQPGDRLELDVKDGVLRVESFQTRLKKIQDEVICHVGPGRSLVDELIAERREEFRREEEAFGQELRRSGSERKAS